MPFQSKSQMGAAFGGFLGPEMKAKAAQWAAETPDPKSLPEHKKPAKKAPSKKNPGQVELGMRKM